ncbi:MAG: antitoxin Xre/MbcA/ParS toxin-binding domain-containing protein [Myxococcaceae bacterium]
MNSAAPVSLPDEAHADRVLSKALVNASRFWGLTQRDLADIVGLSPAHVSRLFHGHAQVTKDSKSGELALLFLRIFRSLDALVGGKEEKARAWLTAPNHALGGIPLRQLRKPEGLVRVAEYLDAVRGSS